MGFRRLLGPVALVVLVAGTPRATLAATATVCGLLGDRLRGRADADTFSLSVVAGERLRVVLGADPGGQSDGTDATLGLAGGVHGPRQTRGPIPLVVETRARASGALALTVRQARRRARRLAGAYCLAVTSSEAAAETLVETADVEVPWVALAADRGSVFPPFEPVASGDWAGLLQPLVPLVGGRVYGVIVTRGVRDHAGLGLEPDTAFAALAGVRHAPRGGPVARFDVDPEASGNPYPEARLVRTDGTIRIPDRVALRGLDPSNPRLAAARADLRATADGLERLGGFSTVQPLEVALSRPVDIATVTPETVLVFPHPDGALDLPGLLAEARRHGVRPRDVALAFSFPTVDVEGGHAAVRARLLELAAASPFGAILDDPDPGDDLPIGVFGPGSSAFGAFLAANPEVARVVVGLLPSREFRAPDGLFDPAVLAGVVPPRTVHLDFVLTLPAQGTPPYPVVLFQHGFGGSNAQVWSRAGVVLARHGLATIGITAPSHGRRGSPLDLLRGSGLQLRDIFRQTNADQMALVRLLEAGLDVDRDGRPDLDVDRLGYLGISLGGLAGGPFVATEARIGAAVLNVMSGRTALNALNAGTRPIFAQFLADRVGLALGSSEFETYLARQIALGQHAADAADSLNFARRWTRQPLPGHAARRVLVQEGLDDALVFTVLTEELAMVAGLATGEPRENPAGVSGHWIFPGGHGIFERPDVQAQAGTYLESGGTQIVDPGPP